MADIQQTPPPAVPARPPQVGDMINPFSRPYTQPRLSYFFLGAIILLFLATLAAGLLTDPSPVLYAFGATWGPDIIDNLQLWRLVTAMFLHASLAHIIFNGLALYVLGLDMERLFGYGRFLFIYMMTGLFGGLVSLAWHGYGEFSVGASGSIFGIIGMQLAFFTYYRRKLGKFGEERFQSMLRLIGINLLIGIAIVRVNNAAHMGGLISGFALGYAFTPRYFITSIIPDASQLRVEVDDTATLLKQWYWALVSVIVLAAGLFMVIRFYGG